MNVNKKHFSIVNQIEVTPDNAIVIVGAAADGPAGVPILVDPNLDPYDVFGYGPLADAYTAVRNSGAKKIVTYRINGIHSKATIRHTDVIGSQDVLQFTTVSAGDKYNDIAITVYPDYIYIDETIVGGGIRSYFFEDYPTAYDLAYGINRDAFYGLVSFTAESLNDNFDLLSLVDTATTISFIDGLDEDEFLLPRLEGEDYTEYILSTKSRLAESLFGADLVDQDDYSPNSHLGMLHFGVIVLAGIFHDDDQEITRMLGEFCMNKTKHMESGCMGVIGTSPLFGTNGEIEEEHVRVKVDTLLALAVASEDIESKNYVQVIVGDSYYNNTLPIVSNAYAYAGTQGWLPYHTIMTNKKISGFSALNYQIYQEDIALLTANGYTCIVPSIRRGFVPFLASTYVKNKLSPMSRPHCVRISQHVTRVLSEELDYLVGATSDYVTQKEIQSIAQDKLQELVDQDIIREFTVQCTFSPRDTEAKVVAFLTPFSEITSVQSTTKVSFPREVI